MNMCIHRHLYPEQCRRSMRVFSAPRTVSPTDQKKKKELKNKWREKGRKYFRESDVIYKKAHILKFSPMSFNV